MRATARKRTCAVGAAVAAGAALGGGALAPQADSAGVAATPASARAADPRAGGLDVSLGEWAVGLEARAIRPGRVTFVIRNRGKLAHGFELEAERERGGDDSRLKVESRTLRPGDSARVTVNLAAGVYVVECSVDGHDDMGMRTTLRLDPKAPLVQRSARPRNAVAIRNFAFAPAVLRVKAGTTIRFRNADSAPHTVSATDGSFSSKTLRAGAVYTRRFTRAGTYAYLCAVHPQMKGRVVVR